MDSLTQGLLGAVTAQLGFRQRIGRDATWIAAVAAYSPDLDVVVPAAMRSLSLHTSPFTRFIVHRGLTHSLLMVPVIAAAVALPWWAIRAKMARSRAKGDQGQAVSPQRRPALAARTAPFWLFYLCCFVAVLSHPLLDWCTSYGTVLFAPISNARLAIDAVPIIDIIFTPLLMLTLAGCWLAGRDSRHKPTAARARLTVAAVGLTLSVGYLAAGRAMHNLAVRKALAIAGDRRVVQADAYPMLGTIFVWRSVVETEDAWILSRIHHFAGPDRPPRMRVTAKTPDNAWIRRARKLDQYRLYRWFANGRLRTEFESHPDMYIVRFHDMRYGKSADAPESLWPLEVSFASDGKLPSAKRPGANSRAEDSFLRQLGMIAGAAWSDIWNP